MGGVRSEQHQRGEGERLRWGGVSGYEGYGCVWIF